MLRAFLQRHGVQKSSFDWIDAVGSERRARLSDGCADYNAPQHVSNMPATPWAEFQKQDTVPPPPPPPHPTSPLPAALEQTPTSELIMKRASQENWPLGCFLFLASSSKRTIKVVASRVQWRRFLFWIAAMQQSIRGSWGFEWHFITDHSKAGDKPGLPLLLFLIFCAWALWLQNVFWLH